MQELTLNRAPDAFTTQPHACLVSGASANTPISTGKERDTESGNDYFGARYYASTMGRWISSDWASNPTAIPYASYANPQSLNLYQYQGNNPLSSADKDGHCWPLCDLITYATTAVSTYVATHPDVARAAEAVAASAGVKLSLGIGGGLKHGPAKLEASASGFVKLTGEGIDSAGVEGKGGGSILGVGGEVSGTVNGVKDGQLVNPLKNGDLSQSYTGSAEMGEHAGASGSVNQEEVSAGLSANLGVAQGGVEVSTSRDAAKALSNAVVDGAATDAKNFVHDLKQTNGCSSAANCGTPH